MSAAFNCKLLFVIFVLWSLITSCHLFSSFQNNFRSYKFATKTIYNHSFTSSDIKIRDNVDLHFPVFCKPIHCDVVLRHGIRNPGTSDINAINLFHHHIASHVKNTSKLIRKLSSWINPFNAQHEKEITHTGKIEQESIARRIGKRFRSLLKYVSTNEVAFFSSDKNRTLESCYAFQKGLHDVGYDFERPPTISNFQLRFFDFCEKYLVLMKSDAAKHESKVFQESKPYKLMMNRFSERLGLPIDFKLKSGILKSVFVIGATEAATFGSSPWLDLLTDDEIKLLEYSSDIRSYWKRGYGYNINYEMSCPLFKEIMNGIDDTIQQNAKAHRAIFRFAHAETTLPLLSLLGLFNDGRPLTGKDFHTHFDRKFKTSKIAPFSSNIGFMLYDCDMDMVNNVTDDMNRNSEYDTSFKWERYMVQIMVNEIPIKLPICDAEFCPLSLIKEKFKKTLHCNFEKLCSLHKDEL